MPSLKANSLLPAHFPVPQMGQRYEVDSGFTQAVSSAGTLRVRATQKDFPQVHTLTFRVVGSALLEEMLLFFFERNEVYIRLQTGVGYLVGIAPVVDGVKYSNHLMTIVTSPKVSAIGYELWDLEIVGYVKDLLDADAAIPI